jgi:hypothetical protein
MSLLSIGGKIGNFYALFYRFGMIHRKSLFFSGYLVFKPHEKPIVYPLSEI